MRRDLDESRAAGRKAWGAQYDRFRFPTDDEARIALARRDAHIAKLQGAVAWTAGGSKPYVGALSPGCRLCVEGRWSCLFVNTRCNANSSWSSSMRSRPVATSPAAPPVALPRCPDCTLETTPAQSTPRRPARRHTRSTSSREPGLAQPLYDPRWYGAGLHPGGIMTSRGCPSGCTFCSNHVTGRRFRHRSTASVIAELRTEHARSGQTFFAFWDDALTANRRHLLALTDALTSGIGFPLTWSAITRVNMTTPDLLRGHNGLTPRSSAPTPTRGDGRHGPAGRPGSSRVSGSQANHPTHHKHQMQWTHRGAHLLLQT